MPGALAAIALLLGFAGGVIYLLAFSGQQSDSLVSFLAIGVEIFAGLLGAFVGGLAAGGAALGHLIVSRLGFNSVLARTLGVTVGSGALVALMLSLILLPIVLGSIGEDASPSLALFDTTAFVVCAGLSALAFVLGLAWRSSHPNVHAERLDASQEAEA